MSYLPSNSENSADGDLPRIFTSMFEAAAMGDADDHLFGRPRHRSVESGRP